MHQENKTAKALGCRNSVRARCLGNPGRAAKGGEVSWAGSLGGKTTMVQEIAAGLGIQEHVRAQLLS